MAAPESDDFVHLGKMGFFTALENLRDPATCHVSIRLIEVGDALEKTAADKPFGVDGEGILQASRRAPDTVETDWCSATIKLPDCVPAAERCRE